MCFKGCRSPLIECSVSSPCWKQTKFFCFEADARTHWERICEGAAAILHIEILSRNMRRGIAAELMIKAIVRFACPRPPWAAYWPPSVCLFMRSQAGVRRWFLSALTRSELPVYRDAHPTAGWPSHGLGAVWRGSPCALAKGQQLSWQNQHKSFAPQDQRVQRSSDCCVTPLSKYRLARALGSIGRFSAFFSRTCARRFLLRRHV